MFHPSQEEVSEILALPIPAHNHAWLDEKELLDLLSGSASTTKSEKKEILALLPNFSKHQLEELLRIFREEKEKLSTLEKQYNITKEQLSEEEREELGSWKDYSPGNAVSTPWGPAQTSKKIAEGIRFYSTASHGGFWITPERYDTLPEAVRDMFPEPWFEEDVDGAVVIAFFPQYFSVIDLESSRRILKEYRPKLFQLLESTGGKENCTHEVRIARPRSNSSWSDSVVCQHCLSIIDARCFHAPEKLSPMVYGDELQCECGAYTGTIWNVTEEKA